MSTSHEDNPPNERPSYPGFSGPDEVTQTELRTPPPRKTLSPEDADRLMVRKALEASAAATEALTRLLPTLATKDDVAALQARLDELIRRVGGLDAGVGAMADELATQDRDIKQGFADVRTILMGNSERSGIAQDVGFLRQQMDSALGAVSVLPPRLTAIEEKLESVAEASAKSLRVACGSWVQVTTGEVDERERETISAIVVSHSSGS